MPPSTNPPINNEVLEKVSKKISNLLGSESHELEATFSFTAKPKVLDALKDLLDEQRNTEIEALKTMAGFHQTLKLREIMEKIFTEWDKNPEIPEKEFALAKWVINEWGGVRNGNEKKLKENLKTSKEGVTFPSNGFASWSKYLAFKNPKEHAIYDARVNYSLNWLLFKAYEECEIAQEERQYFQFLPGANANLNLLEYELFLLLPRHKNIEKFLEKNEDFSTDTLTKKFSGNVRKGAFYAPKDSYENYICLLNEIKEKIYPKDSWGLTKIEMILFAAAPTKIAAEVLNFLNNKK